MIAVHVHIWVLDGAAISKGAAQSVAGFQGIKPVMQWTVVGVGWETKQKTDETEYPYCQYEMTSTRPAAPLPPAEPPAAPPAPGPPTVYE